MKTFLAATAIAVTCTAMTTMPAHAGDATAPTGKIWTAYTPVKDGQVKNSRSRQVSRDKHGTAVWTCGPTTHGQTSRCYPVAAMQ
jgi:hypothetical protein